MYANLFGNSASFQALYMLQGPCRRSDIFLPMSDVERLRRFETRAVYQGASENDLCGADGMTP